MSSSNLDRFDEATIQKAVAQLTEQDRQELDEAFRTYDKNGDGVLTIPEIAGVLHRLGQSPSIPELRAMVRTMDGNTDGVIDKEEFFKWMALRKLHYVPVSPEAIRKLLSEYDKDNDHHIDAKELQKILHELGFLANGPEVNEMLREADLNQDGKISEDELYRAITNKQARGGKWTRFEDLARFSSLVKPISSDPKEREKARLQAKAQGKVLKEITFVRHGQSRANLESDLYHKDLFHWDPPLTEKGVNQAKEAAAVIKKELEENNIKLELIVVSPLPRAVQTATLVFEEQIAAGVKVVGHPLATEQVTGSDDIGNSPAHIRASWPQVDWSILPEQPEVWFWTPPNKTRPTTIEEARAQYQADPQEEPWEDLVQRAEAFEQWLSSRPEQVIAVVAHGDLIEAVAGQSLGNAKFFGLEIEHRVTSAPARV